MKPGNTTLIKNLNKKRVINLIRENKSFSRSELAEETSLNPSTITDIISKLKSENLIKKNGKRKSTGGRKPELLSLNNKKFMYAGISIHSNIHAVILDVNGKIIEKKDFNLNKDKNVNSDTIINLINKLTKNTEIKTENLRGIGIGVPGQVNVKSGVIKFSPQINWKEKKIKEKLERKFDLPIYIDNGMKAKALGESWFGKGQFIKDFVLLNVENGIGSAFVLDKQVYRGYSQGAGEIGHNFAHHNNAQIKKCRCGKEGCLETIASVKALKNRVEDKIKNGYKFPYKSINLKTIFKAWHLKIDFIEQIINNAAFNLGITIANLVNTLDPEKLILSGSLFTVDDNKFFDKIIKVSKKHTFGSFDTKKIVVSNLGKRGVAIGAATLGMNDYFKSDLFLNE